MKEEPVKPEDYLYTLNRKGLKLGLDKIRNFLSNFGEPQNDFDTVLIAGTNGKGSVTTMLSNILTESGYRTGRYISPHLDLFNERISIDGINITDEELWELIDEVKPVLGRIDQENPELRPSFFEVLTTMAYMYFSHQKVDVAVLEVGMGGRLDATNVSDHFASAITTIGFDHMKYLGDTKEKIAYEKAGIIRCGNDLVTGVKEPEIREYLRKVCVERSAEYHHALERDHTITLDPLRLELQGYGTLNIPGIAVWQAENALVSITLAEIMMKKGYEISKENIKRGIEKTVLKGKMEYDNNDPRVMYDSAHNISGMEALVDGLKSRRYRRLLLVMGVLEDKDYPGMVRTIGPICSHVFTGRPLSDRSLDPDRLAEEFKPYCRAESFSTGKEALEAAKDEWKQGDMILITGSIYLLGDIRNELGGGDLDG